MQEISESKEVEVSEDDETASSSPNLRVALGAPSPELGTVGKMICRTGKGALRIFLCEVNK